MPPTTITWHFKVTRLDHRYAIEVQQHIPWQEDWGCQTGLAFRHCLRQWPQWPPAKPTRPCLLLLPMIAVREQSGPNISLINSILKRLFSLYVVSPEPGRKLGAGVVKLETRQQQLAYLQPCLLLPLKLHILGERQVMGQSLMPFPCAWFLDACEKSP